MGGRRDPSQSLGKSYECQLYGFQLWWLRRLTRHAETFNGGIKHHIAKWNILSTGIRSATPRNWEAWECQISSFLSNPFCWTSAISIIWYIKSHGWSQSKWCTTHKSLHHSPLSTQRWLLYLGKVYLKSFHYFTNVLYPFDREWKAYFLLVWCMDEWSTNIDLFPKLVPCNQRPVRKHCSLHFSK